MGTSPELTIPRVQKLVGPSASPLLKVTAKPASVGHNSPRALAKRVGRVSNRAILAPGETAQS